MPQHAEHLQRAVKAVGAPVVVWPVQSTGGSNCPLQGLTHLDDASVPRDHSIIEDGKPQGSVSYSILDRQVLKLCASAYQTIPRQREACVSSIKIAFGYRYHIVSWHHLDLQFRDSRFEAVGHFDPPDSDQRFSGGSHPNVIKSSLLHRSYLFGCPSISFCVLLTNVTFHISRHFTLV